MKWFWKFSCMKIGIVLLIYIVGNFFGYISIMGGLNIGIGNGGVVLIIFKIIM